jgi:hypothetical protein
MRNRKNDRQQYNPDSAVAAVRQNVFDGRTAVGLQNWQSWVKCSANRANEREKVRQLQHCACIAANTRVTGRVWLDKKEGDLK